jgi:hypothetical protein
MERRATERARKVFEEGFCKTQLRGQKPKRELERGNNCVKVRWSKEIGISN